jgi:hypothetical protein
MRDKFVVHSQVLLAPPPLTALLPAPAVAARPIPKGIGVLRQYPAEQRRSGSCAVTHGGLLEMAAVVIVEDGAVAGAGVA